MVGFWECSSEHACFIKGSVFLDWLHDCSFTRMSALWHFNMSMKLGLPS